MTERRAGSLRQRLLRRLWLLLLLLLGGAIASFALARHFAEQVYDRWLWDSAMALETLLQYQDGHARFAPTPAVVRMFEWDSVDRIRSLVSSRRDGRLFGDASIPPPPAHAAPGPDPGSRFYDGIIAGESVRIVAVDVAGPAAGDDAVTIQVAETRHKRSALAMRLLLASIPLQAIVLLLAGLLIWYAVRSSLRSLDAAATQLARYGPDRLAPIAELDDSPLEIRPLADALNNLIARLSEAQDAQRRFVANAAHQLRTPLATLQVQAERALRETDPQRLREALDHLLRALTRMGHLSHQLLTLSRAEPAAQTVLAMRDVDLALLAREELEGWLDRAIVMGTDLGYDGPDAGVRMTGEAQLLRELIGNLIDNALRYGRAGGVVTLGVRDHPPALFVDDDGPGIPCAERELVLERFYRRPGSVGEGCGLGLAIADEIAARHGGVLAIVKAANGHGTRARVSFAAADARGVARG